MTIEEQIRALIVAKKYPDCIRLLIENTCKGKAIDPNKIEDMEKKYSILLHQLDDEGEYMHLGATAHRLKAHLKRLEEADAAHYHKGLLYHNLGACLSNT